MTKIKSPGKGYTMEITTGRAGDSEDRPVE